MGCGACAGGCGDGGEAHAGLVTALLLADEREARAIAEDAAPGRRWPGIDARGFDQVKLATLWALLAGRPYGDELLEAFAPLEEVSGDGPWVFRVPPGLVGALAELRPDRAAEIAAAWARTGELAVEERDPEEVRGLVDALRGVARAAAAARKPLLMRVSL